jgi:hypothetical protein
MPVLRRTGTLGWVLVIAIGWMLGSSAQAADPLSGAWKIDLAKSKYSPANLAPKSGTTLFEVSQDGITAVIDGVDWQGRVTHAEYTAKFDGKPYLRKETIAGKPNPDQDAVVWKKINDYTYETIAMRKGQALTTTRVVISRDGKTRTNTVTGKNAQGHTINNTVVYEKQQSYARKL